MKTEVLMLLMRSLCFCAALIGALRVLLSEIQLLGKGVGEERSLLCSSDKLYLMQLSLTQESVIYIEREHSFLT